MEILPSQISDKLKIKISEQVEQKKVQLRKLQALYSEPEQVPKEIKILNGQLQPGI